MPKCLNTFFVVSILHLTFILVFYLDDWTCYHLTFLASFFFFCPHFAALGNLKCQSKRGSRNFPPERIGGDRKLIFFAWFVRGLLFVPLLCQTNAKFYVFSKLFWEAYHSFKINFYNVINQFRFIKNELNRMCHCFLVMNFLGEQSTHQSIPWR